MAKVEFDDLMSVGIDIGNNTFHIVGFDHDGQRVLRKQIKRLALVTTLENLPRCIVRMKTCLSALSESTGAMLIDGVVASAHLAIAAALVLARHETLEDGLVVAPN
jgi:uncharacterized protein (DUF1786 family)